jgi:hypothetical protein
MRHSKIWELENDDSFDPMFMEGMSDHVADKNPAYKKPERPKAKFVEE